MKAASMPRVFCLDPAALAATKARIAKEPGDLKPALDRLLADAEKALTVKPQSVMDKTKMPPSGDKHDYMSLGPYWWPNPATKNGLPYIRRDGERNPEVSDPATTDRARFSQVLSAVDTLSLAYYLTGREPYAAHAAKLLRVWFLEPATRMNPNLIFGQAVLGINDGRGIGIIETAGLADTVDSIGLLAGSSSWTAADQKGMTDWMARYLDWLLTSAHGKDEAKAKNNHGTYYDVQIASLALFTGQEALARKTLEAAKTKRIASQIKPDGAQPEELARTNSLSYSAMNLRGFEKLAAMGERVGIDLWGFETSDGRGIRKAALFLAPYADPAKPWPHQQISKYDRASLLPLFAAARRHYQEPALNTAAAFAEQGDNRAARYHLLLA